MHLQGGGGSRLPFARSVSIQGQGESKSGQASSTRGLPKMLRRQRTVKRPEVTEVFCTALDFQWRAKCKRRQAAQTRFRLDPFLRRSERSGVGRHDRSNAGSFLRVLGSAQPPGPQPCFRHTKLGVTAIVADQHIRLGKNRWMAQRPRPVAIKAYFRGNKGEIFGFTFRTTHETPQASSNSKTRKTFSGYRKSQLYWQNACVFNENCH